MVRYHFGSCLHLNLALNSGAERIRATLRRAHVGSACSGVGDPTRRLASPMPHPTALRGRWKRDTSDYAEACGRTRARGACVMRRVEPRQLTHTANVKVTDVESAGPARSIHAQYCMHGHETTSPSEPTSWPPSTAHRWSQEAERIFVQVHRSITFARKSESVEDAWGLTLHPHGHRRFHACPEHATLGPDPCRMSRSCMRNVSELD